MHVRNVLIILRQHLTAETGLKLKTKSETPSFHCKERRCDNDDDDDDNDDNDNNDNDLYIYLFIYLFQLLLTTHIDTECRKLRNA